MERLTTLLLASQRVSSPSADTDSGLRLEQSSMADMLVAGIFINASGKTMFVDVKFFQNHNI